MSRRRPQRRFGSISYSQHTSYEPRCQKFRSKSQLDYSAGYSKDVLHGGMIEGITPLQVLISVALTAAVVGMIIFVLGIFHWLEVAENLGL